MVLRVTARLAQGLGQMTPMVGRVCADWGSGSMALKGDMCKTKCVLRHVPAGCAVFCLLASSTAANCSAVFRRSSKAAVPEQKSLDRQALATFGATCVDHSAATFGFHANEETVGTSAAGFGRLISAFHELCVLSSLMGCYCFSRRTLSECRELYKAQPTIIADFRALVSLAPHSPESIYLA